MQQETISCPNHTTGLSTSGVTSEGEADIHRLFVYELKVNLSHYTCMRGKFIKIRIVTACDLRAVSLIVLLSTTDPER